MGEEFRNLLLQLGNLRFRITDMLHVLLDEEASGAELQDDAKRVGGGFLICSALARPKRFRLGVSRIFASLSVSMARISSGVEQLSSSSEEVRPKMLVKSASYSGKA